MWRFPGYEIDTPIDWDHLCETYSWIEDMKGVDQDSIWHSEGDVFVHTQMVIESLISSEAYIKLTTRDKHIVFTAALMHDIEKRSTTKVEIQDGVERIVSPNHAKKGAKTVREILYTELNVPYRTRESIVNLVSYHGLPLWCIEKHNPQHAVVEVSLLCNTYLLELLARADIDGRICEDKESVILKIDLFKELCIENDCYRIKRSFDDDLSRYSYLNKPENGLDYNPYYDKEYVVSMLCGLPGSGKDHLLSKIIYNTNNTNVNIVSLDDIRRDLKIKPTDKKGNGKVIQIAKERVKEYLRSKTSFYFNATNITSDMRSKWVKLFNDYNAYVNITYIEVPYKQLLKQNSNREYPVPENVIKKLIKKMDIPTDKEGHQVIKI